MSLVAPALDTGNNGPRNAGDSWAVAEKNGRQKNRLLLLNNTVLKLNQSHTRDHQG
jgi:hypothetical protein